MKHIIQYTFISFLSLFVNLHAQEIVLKQMPLVNQLPSNSVSRLFQDNNGFLWLGTFDGLCRFDGHELQVFKSDLNNPMRLSNNEITSIAEDKNNNIWIGTQNGIDILYQKNYNIFPLEFDEIKNKIVKCITVASDSTIWVGTEHDGIYQFNQDYSLKNHFSKLTNKGSTPPGGGINSIYEDKEGNLWITAWKHGVYKYTPKDSFFEKYPKIGNQNKPFRVFQDDHGQYWICTWGDSIYLFSPDAHVDKMYSRINLIKNDNVHADDTFYNIVQDNIFKYIWCMSHAGIRTFRYDENNEIKEIRIPNLFKNTNNLFSDIIKDRDGNLWIGSFSEGASMIDFGGVFFDYYSLDIIKEETNFSSHLQTIFEDKEGLIWICQNRIGLGFVNIDSDNITYFNNYAALRNLDGLREVSFVKNIRNTNDYWVGSKYEAVIYVIKKENNTFSLIKQIPILSKIWDTTLPQFFIEDIYSNFWIFSESEIFLKLNNKEELNFFLSISGNITSVTDDQNGNIWMSVDSEGFYNITIDKANPLNSSIEKYINSDYPILANHVIQTIAIDENNIVWIGTKEGRILSFNKTNKSFKDHTEKCRLSGETILNIVISSNNIWISTIRQIIEYNPRNEASTVYDETDGIKINSFLKESYFKNKNGEIYFGGNGGLCKFKSTNRLEKRKKHSEVVITDIKLEGKSLLQNNLNSYYDISKNTLSLEYNIQNLEINFSALDFNHPNKIQYAYRLRNVDNDWVHCPANRLFATYNQLKKGEYIFEVKATDENGLWNDNVALLNITKKPAFYETWFAYLIYFTLICSVFCLILNFFLNRIKLKNELQIAQIEKEKSEELAQNKLLYYTNISHDLLTPVTIISCAMDEIEKDVASQHIDYVSLVRSSSGRLKRLIQQMLDIRRVESGNMELKISKNDIVGLIRHICAQQFELLLKKKNIQFSFNSVHNELQAYFDIDKLEKVVFNLMSNAVKYTPENGDIECNLILYMQNGYEYLQITISDSGIGIDQEEIFKIFNRFYFSNSNFQDSNGVGLSLSKDLIEIHKGNIKVESIKGDGSVFTVEIPIDKMFYNVEDQEELSDAIVFESKEKLSQIIDAENTPSSINDSISILIVEDNLELLGLMKKILSKDYITKTCENGVEALDIIAKNKIDIVVSDIMMPHMDGLTLCKTIKSNLETSHISVILLTARNTIDDRVECYNAGADSYISKPFELKLLEARINNFIKNKQEQQLTFIKASELNLSNLDYISIDKEFLTRATSLIEENIQDSDFDMNVFAKKINMSKSTLYRKIKSLTGLSPVEFVKNIRLKHACKMLKDKSISISEVAYSSGFSNPKYFAVCFKDEFGITPSEYQSKDRI